jgi:acetyltransferase
MDMIAGAGAEQFRKTLGVIKHDPQYDTIIPIFVPPVTIDQMDVAVAIRDAVADTDKSVLACFMGAGEGSSAVEFLKSHRIPVYIFPEAVAKTVSTIDEYRLWLDKPRGKYKSFKVNTAAVNQVIERVLGNKDGAIVGDDAIEILEAYGIPAAPYHFAGSPKEAVAVANDIGYPVVMKINTPQILHKTELGAVLVDLRNDKEVRDGWKELETRLAKARMKKREKMTVALQQMISGEVETVIGMVTDPQFGPLLMFGLGGIFVEVMKDVAFRINPLTDASAREMIESLRSYRLLTGFRGSAPVDIDRIVDTLLRVSQLVRDFDCFSEIDINPFIVSADKSRCKAVDARFIVRHAHSRY